MFRDASILPTVEGFLLYASAAVTQQDAAAQKRGKGYNSYALPQYLAKLDSIRSRMRRKLTSSDENALRDLIAELSEGFNLSYMPGIKKTIRAIEEYLATGKEPRYPGSSKRPRVGSHENQSLRKSLIRLAHAKPHLRDMLIPLLSEKRASSDPADIAWEIITGGPRLVLQDLWSSLERKWDMAAKMQSSFQRQVGRTESVTLVNSYIRPELEELHEELSLILKQMEQRLGRR